MNSLFFNFEALDREIEKKLLSRTLEPALLFEDLLRQIEQGGMPETDIASLKRLFESLRHENEKLKPEYLSHPVRVASGFLQNPQQGTYEQISLALCHNLKEKLGDRFEAFAKAYLTSSNLRKIKLLTIDRMRQQDPVYLKDFYDGIEKEGPELLGLKGWDKLDNVLCWVLFDLEPYHAEMIYREVCPRLSRWDSRLSKYLNRLTSYVSSDSVKQNFRHEKKNSL